MKNRLQTSYMVQGLNGNFWEDLLPTKVRKEAKKAAKDLRRNVKGEQFRIARLKHFKVN